ncbi:MULTISPECIES: aryl-sulfate sulfotransferase [Haloferax]|nr:aryl-sulfate sulfotransferase [Haloferax mediterranei]MDX5987409.1 arylsulfotransferase family protein [Haloferax mediterranei ATCC 33500]
MPRRHLARALAALVVSSLLVSVGISALTHTPTDSRTGTVESPADGPTVVGIQGFHFRGQGATKKPARLISVGPKASLHRSFDGSRVGAQWFYDVDPVGDNDILVSATIPQGTVVVRFDRLTGKVVWSEQLPYHDTHDVDSLGDGKLLIANMRQYNETTSVSNDRLLVYDRHEDEVVWEWLFHEHYPNSTDGGFAGDWTHVNDVDKVGDGLYLASPRNFDQVIVVNRSTGEIELRLGEDDTREILHRQHNPDLIRGPNGSVSVLVADSENDRVVEYTRHCEDGKVGVVEADPEDCEWERTWTLAGGLNWPRDADRLPNGNTLVTDTLNHRVIEVTPEGRIVWEYYATWGPYDAERIGTGDGSNGPPMVSIDAPKHATLSNSVGVTPGTGDRQTFHGWLTETTAGTPLSGPVEKFALRWAHVTPWLTPVWMTGWDFARTILAMLVLLGWTTVETYYRRERLWDRVNNFAERVRAASDDW